jgi:two-component system, chemotaxis family, chemotaxis protein CheY
MLSPKTKVLLVDDDELVRQLLARLLTDDGFFVAEADNGASALQAARRLDGSLSLVVTDINMPVMDGLEFARALRATDRQIPFLFVTALDPALVHIDGLKAEILSKPFTPDAFLEAVSRLIMPVTGPGQVA